MGPHRVTEKQVRAKKCELLRDYRSVETTHLTVREKNRLVRSYTNASMAAWLMLRKVVTTPTAKVAP